MNECSEKLSVKIADRMNEIGLKQNPTILAILGYMLANSLALKGTLVIHFRDTDRQVVDFYVLRRRKK